MANLYISHEMNKGDALGNSIMDIAYRAFLSDHCMVYLLPLYRQRLKSDKPLVRGINAVQNSQPVQQLQESCGHCSRYLQGKLHGHPRVDLHGSRQTVASHISCCQDLHVPTKTVKRYGNGKPWFTRSSEGCDTLEPVAIRVELLIEKKANDEVQRAIRRAKVDFRLRVKWQFKAKNT